MKNFLAAPLPALPDIFQPWFGLWSFKVMKALFAARASILLSTLRFFAICFSAEIILAAASVGAFL